jgi:hypothetical protein
MILRSYESDANSHVITTRRGKEWEITRSLPFSF